MIAITLAQQENFTELTVSNENISVNIRNVSIYNSMRHCQCSKAIACQHVIV